MLKLKRWIRVYCPIIERAHRRYKLKRAFSGSESRSFKGRVLIASHERSGTHLAMNTLFLNTDIYKDYSDDDNESFLMGKRVNLVKTHSFPEDVDWQRFDRVIYIYRKPLDVMVSFDRFLKSPDFIWDPAYTPTWDDVGGLCEASIPEHFLRSDQEKELLKNKTFLDRWCLHMHSWEKVLRENPERVIALEFEQLKNSADLLIEQVRNLPGLTITRTEIPDIKSHPSIQPGTGLSARYAGIKSDRAKLLLDEAEVQYFPRKRVGESIE